MKIGESLKIRSFLAVETIYNKEGVTMLISTIKEVIELVKEFITLQSPVEVYLFVGSVWLTGVGVGYLLG